MVGYTALQDDGMLFDPSRPYRGCLICGCIFQTPLDRIDNPTDQQVLEAQGFRDVWASRHAKTHTDREHRLLQLSGAWCTPEAAQRLATFGIYSLTDMVLSPEHEHAYRTAPRSPSDDTEHA